MDPSSLSKMRPPPSRPNRGNERGADVSLAAAVTQRHPTVQLYDLETVAEMTALSLSTLRRAIRARRLACHRVGSRIIRISEDDLMAYLNRHRKAAR